MPLALTNTLTTAALTTIGPNQMRLNLATGRWCPKCSGHLGGWRCCSAPALFLVAFCCAHGWIPLGYFWQPAGNSWQLAPLLRPVLQRLVSVDTALDTCALDTAIASGVGWPSNRLSLELVDAAASRRISAAGLLPAIHCQPRARGRTAERSRGGRVICAATSASDSSSPCCPRAHARAMRKPSSRVTLKIQALAGSDCCGP